MLRALESMLPLLLWSGFWALGCCVFYVGGRVGVDTVLRQRLVAFREWVVANGESPVSYGACVSCLSFGSFTACVSFVSGCSLFFWTCPG